MQPFASELGKERERGRDGRAGQEGCLCSSGAMVPAPLCTVTVHSCLSVVVRWPSSYRLVCSRLDVSVLPLTFERKFAALRVEPSTAALTTVRASTNGNVPPNASRALDASNGAKPGRFHARPKLRRWRRQILFWNTGKQTVSSPMSWRALFRLTVPLRAGG